MQLVGDEDDRHALAHEVPEDAEELARLLRRQHRGRLVEDEDLRAAGRAPSGSRRAAAGRPMMSSTRASGSTAKLNVSASSCTRSSRGVRSRAATPRRVGSVPSTMFSATVITGMSMKCWCTMPIPRSIASFGEWIAHGLALDEDLALVRVVEAVEDAHQRRLARAVLAEQRVDLAGAQVEVDVVVREHARELLRDPAQLEDDGAVAHARDSMAFATRFRTERGRALGPPSSNCVFGVATSPVA